MTMLAACTTEQRSEPAKPDEPAKLGKLGTVNFPTSGSQQAQVHFLWGVAALHSFWYAVALDEFRESTRIEPDFMMGYWGEAMAHNHPIWGDPQETEAARKVLEKIKDTPKLTPRERAWLQVVKILYGEGDKPTRDRAYSAAMEKIHRDYPDDAEAALFYALSLLGTVHPEDPAGLQTGCARGPSLKRFTGKTPITPARRIMLSMRMMILSTPIKRSTPRGATLKSPPKRHTRCTCLRISSCNSGCGRRRPRRTKRRGRLQING
jgi:hypothetical protein